MTRTLLLTITALLTWGCVRQPPPPPEPEPIIPPAPDIAWTSDAETVVQAGTRRLALAHRFTRLDVAGPRGPDSLEVRCGVCRPAVEGVIARDDVVYEAMLPALAEEEPLESFLIAVRAAAAERDLDALRAVMAREFTFAIEEGHGIDMALRRWRSERFTRLDRVPDLLDRGVATGDGSLWIAPADFVDDPRYQGPRAGFERDAEGRWRWLFFVGGP